MFFFFKKNLNLKPTDTCQTTEIIVNIMLTFFNNTSAVLSIIDFVVMH